MHYSGWYAWLLAWSTIIPSFHHIHLVLNFMNIMWNNINLLGVYCIQWLAHTVHETFYRLSLLVLFSIFFLNHVSYFPARGKDCTLAFLSWLHDLHINIMNPYIYSNISFDNPKDLIRHHFTTKNIYGMNSQPLIGPGPWNKNMLTVWLTISLLYVTHSQSKQ